jgi:hypothetical protein
VLQLSERERRFRQTANRSAPNGDSADDLKRLQRRHHDRHRRVKEPLQVAEPAQQFERRLPLGRVGRLIYGLGHQRHGREGMSGPPS